jgi:hypothetical protein
MKNRERWLNGFYIVRLGGIDGEQVLSVEFKNEEEEQKASEKAFALFHKFNTAGQNSKVERYASEHQVIVDSNDTED